MRNRIERLRIWLLGSAVFLMLVIAAYIGAAHYVKHRFLASLPAKLGIVRETNGYTYCLPIQGRTAYCIYADKAVEHTDGKVGLHNVSVMLYGKKGDRRDHISGQDFEYDRKAGLIRALGVVHIDLQAADAAGAPAMGSAKPEAQANPETNGAKVVHVTTSGLVYMQNLGVAATNDPIEFQAGAMTGHATGADYSSDSGLLTLHSSVSMSGIAGGRPVELTAATAEFDEHSQQAVLTHARYVSQGRSAAADEATLHRRPDGTLARVEAQGKVTIQAQGATTVSQRADVALNNASEPESAVLTGEVLYTLDEPLRQVRGQANEANITFDGQAKPQPEHAVFNGAVRMIERTRATEAAREPWSVRDLTAEKFDAELARTSEAKPQLHDAEASGNAHLTLVDNGSLVGGAGAGRKELSADDLKAHMLAAGDAKQPPQLDTIAGRGHTILRQVSADGTEQTSTGDTLDAKFRAAVKTQAAAGGAEANRAGAMKRSGRGAGDFGTVTLASALQQGHITMTRRAPAKQGSAANALDELRHATAERVVYDGDLDRATLTGSVEMTDAGSVVWANQVAVDRATGDAHALGLVKVDYVRDDSAKPGAARSSTAAAKKNAEPTHVLADRAELDHATNIATFYGKPVRLWQGGAQVQAPEIEVSPEQKRLIARGTASTGWSTAEQPAEVHTVLVSAKGESTGTQSFAASPQVVAGTTAKCGTGTGGAGAGGAGKTGTAAGGSQAMRIASGGLVYSGILGQAEFTGGVRADTVEATIHANQATAYLDQTARGDAAGETASNGSGALPSLDGELDHVVAAGHVDIVRPGFQAMGERLVYTTADQVFLLTGDGKTPPKAVDAQGTTTAAALRLRNTCDAGGGVSVEALGEVPGEPKQRVHTESRVREDRKKESK